MIQAKLFLMFLLFGAILGAIWGLLNFAKLTFKNNVVIKHILDVPYAALFVLGFFAMLIQNNYGEFRLYLLAAWCFGTYLERKTIGKLFAKVYFWLYNKLRNACLKLKQTKFFSRVFK